MELGFKLQEFFLWSMIRIISLSLFFFLKALIYPTTKVYTQNT